MPAKFDPAQAMADELDLSKRMRLVGFAFAGVEPEGRGGNAAVLWAGAPAAWVIVAGEVRIRCPLCGETSSSADWRAQGMVCPWCSFHFPLTAGQYLAKRLKEIGLDHKD